MEFLETFLGGMETSIKHVPGPEQPRALETFLGGMETGSHLGRARHTPHLETFLGGMETVNLNETGRRGEQP